MSARLKVWGACRTLAIRARPAAPRPEPLFASASRRWYADDTNNATPPPTQPVGGEAETGSEPTPVDPAAAMAFDAGLPQPLGDEALEKLFYGGKANPKEGDGGLTVAQEEALFREGRIPSPSDAEALAEAESETVQGAEQLGHNFPLPQGPFDRDYHLKKRYHPVLDQLTKLMMKDGKMASAQRNMMHVMNFLRISPAPIYSPKFPLLPGTPPGSHLPLNPILYITIAIDSVAPIIRIHRIAGGAGGGRALEVPTPLGVRQRRRTAFTWILDAVKNRPSKGSGKTQFPQRLAEEIIAVVEGRSTVWDKRKTIHKLGTATRSNVGARLRGKKGPGKR
ncbi:hypothetical protein N3K66_004871 [Trichothecium roseum]|uniref:Uncharacterized protein n=1 Tax=Trichothecium roseum TaxID=47278 RepID=A0ACC0V2E4_9HYPO|nr:hypothetical protein N3K66_004871 [Trichothecium roseum]